MTVLLRINEAQHLCNYVRKLHLCNYVRKKKKRTQLFLVRLNSRNKNSRELVLSINSKSINAQFKPYFKQEMEVYRKKFLLFVCCLLAPCDFLLTKLMDHATSSNPREGFINVMFIIRCKAPFNLCTINCAIKS